MAYMAQLSKRNKQNLDLRRTSFELCSFTIEGHLLQKGTHMNCFFMASKLFRKPVDNSRYSNCNAANTMQLLDILNFYFYYHFRKDKNNTADD